MNGISWKAVFAVGGLSLALALTSDGRAQSAAAGPAPKMAEEVFKNIQVLKGMPAGLLGPTMEFFRTSLGMGCSDCHVSEEFEREDKPAKQVTRKMIQMTTALNENAFGGRAVVTCYTCHRGSPKPVGMHPVTSPEPTARTKEEVGITDTGRMPTVDQVLDRYVTAIGGADAIQKISSRVAKGTVTDSGGGKFRMEILTKPPDKRMAVMHLAVGDIFTFYDGDVGWTRTPGSGASASGAIEPEHLARNMRTEDLDEARLEDPLWFAGRVKQVFSDLRVERTEKVEGREAYVVFGRMEGSDGALTLVKLYFDKESGLLARLVYSGESLFGPVPIFQFDYADYRRVDGVKIPFRWTIDKPRRRENLRFTYQVDDVRQNIPIEDSRFAAPASTGCRPPRCSGPSQD